MAKGDVRNSKRFQELAGLLRGHAELHNIALVGSEAEELLSAHLAGVANRLGVTERAALADFISEDTVAALAEALASQEAEYHAAAEGAEPVALEAAEAGHVIAALGMAVKLAVEHVEDTRTASLGVITDAADSFVRIGGELLTATLAEQLEFGGHELALTRGILVDTIENLRSGKWWCPCGPHAAGAACGLVANLDSDLHRIGGWVPQDSPE
jgi:hypothetical protein